MWAIRMMKSIYVTQQKLEMSCQKAKVIQVTKSEFQIWWTTKMNDQCDALAQRTAIFIILRMVRMYNCIDKC